MMGDTYLWLKKELHKSDKEIKKMTVPELNLLLQRCNEPVYQREIDQKVQEQKEKTIKVGAKRGRR
jgi:hypothetical protein